MSKSATRVSSGMKLLDLPPNLCDHVECVFQPDTWEEFDRTVAWLVKNGVPLEYRDEKFDKHRVFINGKHPYVNGSMLNVTHQKTFGYVSGQELVAEYTVYMPDHIR